MSACKQCDIYRGHPCCDEINCDPGIDANESLFGIESCIHCGTEMHLVDRDWYCHQQLDENGRPISPPQKYGANQ